FFVTFQAKLKPAAVSTELGSVTLLPSVMAVPSRLCPDDGTPVMAAVGGTLLMFAVVLLLLLRPSASVTVSVTLYVPLSAYVCEGLSVPEPVVPSPKFHRYVYGVTPPSTEPAKVTAAPSFPLWPGPALATGAGPAGTAAMSRESTAK